MYTTRLTDLNELALTVRNEVSRSYIMEAITTYQSGNYRAAILSAWIAVTYDIIAKLRELAVGNDQNARKFVDELENAVTQNNIPNLQRIETGLLDIALKDFEFLSLHEHTDLKRLHDDRHLCAHPALTRDEVLFQPTPELVRTHIVHSITHLLQHKPVQGKSALDRIESDIKSNSFPSDVESVGTYLNSKYLDRAKPALIRNAIIVLVKMLLRGEGPELLGKEDRIVHSLITIRRRHAHLYEEVMPQKMPQLVADLPDERLASFFALLSVDERCWTWVSDAERIKISEVIKRYSFKPTVHDPLNAVALDVRGAMVVDDLRAVVLNSLDELETEQRASVISRYPHPVFAPSAIGMYASVGNYRTAESIGKSVILPMAEYFGAEDVVKILKWVETNDQIWAAMGTQDILEKFFEKTSKHLGKTREAWRDLLAFGFDEGSYRAVYFQTLAERLAKHNITHTGVAKLKESL